MNVIVCCKLAPDSEDIQIKPDGSISLENAEWKIGQYDRPAIEAGVQLVESAGGSVTALSAGAQKLNNSKARKDILSRGPDDLYLVVDERLDDADSHFTARSLAAAIRRRGVFDLVICGEGSPDLYAQQVGLQLGELLGVPTTNSVAKINLEDGKLIVERNLEDEIETLEMPLPAVVSVTADICEPRVASMKNILAAGKKPVTVWTLDDLPFDGKKASARQVLSTNAPRQAQRKGKILKGKPEETAAQLVAFLSKEGVL